MLCFQIDMDDIVQADRWSFYPGLYDKFSRNLPALKAEVCSESKLKIPVDVEKNEKTVSMPNLILSHYGLKLMEAELVVMRFRRRKWLLSGILN